MTHCIPVKIVSSYGWLDKANSQWRFWVVNDGYACAHRNTKSYFTDDLTSMFARCVDCNRTVREEL